MSMDIVWDQSEGSQGPVRPKTGSHRAQNTANKLGDFVFVLGSLMYFVFVVCGGGVFFIIPKWLIKVPGHIPLTFGSFLALPKM